MTPGLITYLLRKSRYKPTMFVDSSVALVLFDLDGTLVDSAADLGHAANQMRMSRGLAELPLHLYRARAGSGARGMLAVAFSVTSDSPKYEALRDEFLDVYETYLLKTTRMFPEVPAVIDALGRRAFRWGIVTNKAARFSRPLVAAMPALKSCTVLVSGDTTPFTKPHPAPLLEAARYAAVDPGRCVYVGDDERDVIAGRAAGMRTVAAAYGYLGVGSNLHDWGADGVIYSPMDLLQLLPSA